MIGKVIHDRLVQRCHLLWLFAALLILMVSMCTGCGRFKKIAQESLGSNRELILYADRDWEVSRGYLYEVVDNRRVVVPMTVMYFDDPSKTDPGFRVISSKDIAVVVTAERPSVAVVAHDFRSGLSYPRLTMESASEEDLGRRKDEILKSVHSRLGDDKYILSGR